MRGTKLSVLIVDDEKDVLNALVCLLKSTGMFDQIVTASDGLIAFNKTQNQNFDLVITDYKMPKMDGMTFIKYLRGSRKSGGPETKVLFISGHFTQEVVKQAIKCKVKHFLTKPFGGDAFLKKINEIMRQSQARVRCKAAA